MKFTNFCPSQVYFIAFVIYFSLNYYLQSLHLFVSKLDHPSLNGFGDTCTTESECQSKMVCDAGKCKSKLTTFIDVKRANTHTPTHTHINKHTGNETNK